jgi:intein/homing endonuclease
MVGTGVGFRILPTDVAKLPKFKDNVKLRCFYHADEPWGNPTTTLEHISDKSLKITVGDSKEGWVTALEQYLEVMTGCIDGVENLYIDLSRIRPKGTPLKTFGGTASGFQSVKEMFEKLHSVITEGAFSHKPVDGKLKPIHCLDICNIIGQNVVVGGVRRTSEIAIISPYDTECINAKRNLTPDKYHRFMSNNSVYLEEKPTKEQLTKIFQSIRECGEPGFINVQEAKRRREDFAGMNPCLLGDMQLLTESGYVDIGFLDGRDDVRVVSYDGTVSTGKVWKSGEKECISLKLSDNREIKCTPNHVFMLNDGTEEEAENLLGKRLMPYLNKPYGLSDEYVKLGFIQGDGILSDLANTTKRGVGINFGEKDKDVAELFGVDFDPDKGRIVYYTTEFTNKLKELEFSEKQLTERAMPKTVWNWTAENQLAFLRGMYTANGSVIKTNNKNIRIGYKTTSKELAVELVSLLSEFNITAYITVNKARYTEFKNGTYLCKESYDVNIQQYQSKLLFHNLIGFVQTYKNNALYYGLLQSAPKVKGKKNIGIHPVYDFTEPNNHWGVVEGYVAHNCAEIILPPNAVCNLTTINLTAFVNKDGEIDFNGLEQAVKLSARAAYRMTCLDLELPEWNEVHHRDRLLGCSVTGYQDFCNMAKPSNNKQSILESMRGWTRAYADLYASELGTPYSLKVTAVKPEGTLSLVANAVSPGIHHQHAPYFIRRIRVNASDPLAKTAVALGWRIHPEVGQTMDNATTLVIDFPCHSPSTISKNDVSAVQQLDIYRMFQKHYTEQNTSNTITVKPHEWEDVTNYVYDNWEDILAVTFLATDGKNYPLMPYEECTKEEYEELKSKMKKFDQEILNNMEITTRNFGQEYEILDDRTECASGVCPIR